MVLVEGPVVNMCVGPSERSEPWAITHRTRSKTSTMQPIPVPPCHASIYLELFKLLFGGVVSVFLRSRPTIFIATTWQRALFLTSQKFSFQFQPFEIQKFTGSGGSPHQATLSKADFREQACFEGLRLQT